MLCLVICAGYRSSAKHYIQNVFLCTRLLFMKMVLNFIHIWSVDLFLVEEKEPERFFVRMQQFDLGTVPSALV